MYQYIPLIVHSKSSVKRIRQLNVLLIRNIGHKDIQVTLNTYFDAFAEYKNKFEEQSYNYNQDNNLNYAEKDKSLIIKRELENITFYIKHSIIEETYKNNLLYNIAVISQKYRQSENIS